MEPDNHVRTVYAILLHYTRTIIYIQETSEIPNLPWKPKLTNEKSEIKKYNFAIVFIFVPLCLIKIHNRKKFITLMPYIIMSSNFANMFIRIITQMSDFYKFLFYNFLLINVISILRIFNKFTFKIQISLEILNIFT